ncbi:MAG: response regulator [Candidatus Scalindua sp.]
MNTKKKILVVDDNVDFCTNIKEIIELEGYDAEAVYDGSEVLDAVKGNGFDLILMDIRMPGMDGVETFMKIKEISPETPVIMMTAYAEEERIKTALREGAFGTYQKPLDYERLFCSIKKAIHSGALVMIADDNVELCANINDVLVENGYRGSVAGHGEMAVQMARENKFDIVLLDMRLPDMSGLEAYKTIRDVRKDVVVIIITGHMEEMKDFVEQTLKINAYACMEKPLDLDRLLEIMQNVLEAKSSGKTIKKPHEHNEN